MTPGLTVGIVGCGLIGHKRAEALRAQDAVVAACDVRRESAEDLAAAHPGAIATAELDEVLAARPDVVVVAATHDELAPIARRALGAGAHVLVEKPAGLGVADVDGLRAAADRAGRLVKVGFNHRFHPGLTRAAEEVHSGRHGELLHVRGRYGHGGRPGYDREWRAEPARSGGGELVDQGMHLLDLTHWLAGPLPLHSALLRTQFWDTVVDDNAALLLGRRDAPTAPWATLHVSWTEWKNLFSLEIYCRNAKLAVDGLVRSYGAQTLRIFTMKPEMGPPDVEALTWPNEDGSWIAEWKHFAAAIESGADAASLLGNLADARYCWTVVEAAYAASGYQAMRAQVAA